ncbi:uncharacterized protein LOC142342410 [Convolutriloba macropyga]|uniref:uncharacterized protein LOC142342410 n=1 Tax=Convolutriloba macropyga TaxID=536237 RepID=UPI003F527545
MEVENSASDDEYEEIEEHILVEFEGALSRQFLREESSSLVISQLLDKPFMSVGPLSFEGRYEHLPHTSVIFTAPELPKTQQETNEEATTNDDDATALTDEKVEYITSCTRKIAMKRVIITPKEPPSPQQQPSQQTNQNQVNIKEQLISTPLTSHSTSAPVSDNNVNIVPTDSVPDDTMVS